MQFTRAIVILKKNNKLINLTKTIRKHVINLLF